MTEKRDVETVLADMRDEAETLRRARTTVAPDRLLDWADAIRGAIEDWVVFLDEKTAALRAGRSDDWVRARFEFLKREGHAKLVNGRRYYRACFIPRRANVDSAAERGRQAAREQREQRGPSTGRRSA